MKADESGARGRQDAQGLGALTHQSAPIWNARVEETDEGWVWRVRAPNGRVWSGLAESAVRALSMTAERLRKVAGDE